MLSLYDYRCKTISPIEPIFNTKRVVFYPQHQDDETLWAAGAIRNAVHYQGAENVYVVLVSAGTGLKFFKNPDAYENFITPTYFAHLTPRQQYRIRTGEFRRACERLGVLPSHIIVIPERIGLDELPYDEERALALQFEALPGSVTHVTHTYCYDNHPAHRHNGAVIKRLKDEHLIKHAAYFVKPAFAKLKTHMFAYNVIRPRDRQAVEAAINAYDHDRYKVGLISSPRAFLHLLMDPFYTVYLQVDKRR